MKTPDRSSFHKGNKMSTSNDNLKSALLMINDFLDETDQAKKHHIANMQDKTKVCLACVVEILIITLTSECHEEHGKALQFLLEPFEEFWNRHCERGAIDERWAFDTWPMGKTWLEVFEAENIKIEPNSLVNLKALLSQSVNR